MAAKQISDNGNVIKNGGSHFIYTIKIDKSSFSDYFENYLRVFLMGVYLYHKLKGRKKEMQFKWIESSEGKCVQVDEKYIGYVVFVGEDLHGNNIYDATAYDKASRDVLVCKECNYIEDAVKIVETAIRRAIR